MYHYIYLPQSTCSISPLNGFSTNKVKHRNSVTDKKVFKYPKILHKYHSNQRTKETNVLVIKGKIRTEAAFLV